MVLAEKHIWQGVRAAVVVAAARKIPRNNQSVGHWCLKVDQRLGSSSAVTLGFSVWNRLFNTQKKKLHRNSHDDAACRKSPWLTFTSIFCPEWFSLYCYNSGLSWENVTSFILKSCFKFPQNLLTAELSENSLCLCAVKAKWCQG